jgi:hypothetical protein
MNSKVFLFKVFLWVLLFVIIKEFINENKIMSEKEDYVSRFFLLKTKKPSSPILPVSRSLFILNGSIL